MSKRQNWKTWSLCKLLTFAIFFRTRFLDFSFVFDRCFSGISSLFPASFSSSTRLWRCALVTLLSTFWRPNCCPPTSSRSSSTGHRTWKSSLVSPWSRGFYCFHLSLLPITCFKLEYRSPETGLIRIRSVSTFMWSCVTTKRQSCVTKHRQVTFVQLILLSGQWIRFSCTALQPEEFHSFTLTSAPHEV